MNDKEKAVYNAVCSIPKSTEEISEETGIPFDILVKILLHLSSTAVIRELPGNLFIRTNLKG